MNIDESIKFIEKQIGDPKLGLPEEVFFFASRIVPMVNVDLLIKDEKKRILLAWRDDQYAGAGWHVPGGIVRYKENWEQRVRKVAEMEIGMMVEFDLRPIAFNQIFLDHKTRGHFISILFRCFLSGKFIPKNEGLKQDDVGYLRWHDTCPKNLVEVQKIYRKFIKR
ncbi:NUDIX domain-containing protein [Patescibacteria group bacterium]|nr:NUDIX domain-containing protein [Patescibacteria group bacterium]MCG2702545.1 NUDIX domain-containing protein [Candidatus Parcubacteria bacterium]MBU4265105.1 NUDIX domain-containing protein [Patescibacteria group bacterium]MBU4390669.1 NUDIX domain-containing protein [Patescibacteria group bacterium]MBU4396622.1 NUDIX domain-containing protein [Patescibacteria group bacterium]